MIKYFHELTEIEYNEIVKSKRYKLVSDFEEDYPQPVWCEYEGAVYGVMGCWSLVDFLIKGEDSCENCDCYKKKAVETK